jgi:NADPH:quinone reductase-like Zn-dependent oxidoreductase
MKAIRIHIHGDPKVLRIDDLPVPKLSGDGTLLVRIRAAAMNHMDLWVRQGMPGVKIPLPIILGCEGAGIVEEVGSGVKNFKKGDEVVISPGTSCGQCESCLSGNDHHCRSYGIYGEHRDGTEVEYKVVPEENLLPKPKNISFEEAATIPLTFLTAWQMLVDRAQVGPGKQVLILAAASGVGSAGVQISKLFGARVIATVGSDEKSERVKELGADEVINHREQDIAEEVKKLTDRRGADIVFEHVGAATWEKSLRCLAFSGRLVTCGATTGYDVKVDLRHLFIKQQQILGSTMGPKASLFKIMRLMEEKRLWPVLDQVFPFSEIQKAHLYLEKGSQMGKVVLIPY